MWELQKALPEPDQKALPGGNTKELPGPDDPDIIDAEFEEIFGFNRRELPAPPEQLALPGRGKQDALPGPESPTRALESGDLEGANRRKPKLPNPDHPGWKKLADAVKSNGLSDQIDDVPKMIIDGRVPEYDSLSKTSNTMQGRIPKVVTGSRREVATHYNDKFGGKTFEAGAINEAADWMTAHEATKDFASTVVSSLWD